MLISLIANYDREADILYIRTQPYPDSYAEEDDDGVVTLHAIFDDEITGMVIYDFKARLQDGSISNLSLPFAVDFHSSQISKIIADGATDFKCKLA